MRNYIWPVASVVIAIATITVGLVACSQQQLTTVSNDGRLFCAVATAEGPIIVSLANAEGVPVTVTNQSAAAVAAACAVIDGIPVTPPAAGTTVPVVASSTTLPAITAEISPK
jgi:hypothetical protein